MSAAQERQGGAIPKATLGKVRVMMALAWQLSARSRVPFSIERIKP